MNQESSPTEDKQPEHAPGARASDHLANERTALAWIRTSLAIIGLGFVISRFGLLLRAQAQPALPPTTVHYSYILGLALVALGIITLIIALVSFLRVRLALERNQFQSTPHLLVFLMGSLALLGVCLFLYMWLVG